MRQRLSSEPDRYRGRRRVPTPPRSRYAVVGAAAFVGAGVVALGAASNLPDAKAVNPTCCRAWRTPRSPPTTSRTAPTTPSAPTVRATAAQGAPTKVSDEEAEAEAWLLPLDDYTFTSPYGVRFGQAARRHRPGRPGGHAVQGGPRRRGDRGRLQRRLRLRDHDQARTTASRSSTRTRAACWSRRATQVKAGQVIGEVGNTGALVRHAPAPRDPRRTASRPTRSRCCATTASTSSSRSNRCTATSPLPDRTLDCIPAPGLQLGWVCCDTPHSCSRSAGPCRQHRCRTSAGSLGGITPPCSIEPRPKYADATAERTRCTAEALPVPPSHRGPAAPTELSWPSATPLHRPPPQATCSRPTTRTRARVAAGTADADAYRRLLASDGPLAIGAPDGDPASRRATRHSRRAPRKPLPWHCSASAAATP